MEPTFEKVLLLVGDFLIKVQEIEKQYEKLNTLLRKLQESGNWSLCADLCYTHDLGSMISYHKNLTTSGYRVLIYSGDYDMCVPFTGTQAWTQSLGYQIVDEWRPWRSNGQIAGFLQEYANNFIFLTVKGAGHTVPEYKPRESLDFCSRWLTGQRIYQA